MSTGWHAAFIFQPLILRQPHLSVLHAINATCVRLSEMMLQCNSKQLELRLCHNSNTAMYLLYPLLRHSPGHGDCPPSPKSLPSSGCNPSATRGRTTCAWWCAIRHFFARPPHCGLTPRDWNLQTNISIIRQITSSRQHLKVKLDGPCIKRHELRSLFHVVSFHSCNCNWSCNKEDGDDDRSAAVPARLCLFRNRSLAARWFCDFQKKRWSFKPCCGRGCRTLCLGAACT